MRKLALPILMVTVLAFILPAIADAKHRGHKNRGHRNHNKHRTKVVYVRPYVSPGYISAYWHRYDRPGLYGPYPHGWDGIRYGALGRIDVDVKPKATQVYVDGNYVGTAGKLDGFPDFLWLKQGKYELTLYHPGYETQTRKIAVFPRLKVGIEAQMSPGETTPPPKANSQ